MIFDHAAVLTFLKSTPLTGLGITLAAYLLAQTLWRKGKMSPLLNPVLFSIMLVSAVLWVTGLDYATYFDGAKLINFLLGPTTVALAVPLYRQVHVLMKSALPLLAGLLAGSVTAIVSAMGLGWLLGAKDATLLALAPKSATAPIAMGIAEKIGGAPSLTAVLVILTGITGAIGGAWLLDLLRIRDERARGLAFGVASHGIGTARALQLGPVVGAFSGLAMGLNGVATAILVPLILSALK